MESPMRRGILLVEPDIAVLSADAILLAQSDYSVTTASSHREIFLLRHTRGVALAILSDCLGQRILREVAEAVRTQWPFARILILGRATSVLDDHLYDEETLHPLEPKKLLNDLERLYKDSWNPPSNTLDWKAERGSRCVTELKKQESDPTKMNQREGRENCYLRGTPTDIRFRQC